MHRKTLNSAMTCIERKMSGISMIYGERTRYNFDVSIPMTSLPRSIVACSRYCFNLYVRIVNVL